MQLYQSGFRPAQGYSVDDARAQQQEQAAKQQTLRMQQQQFQWELDKRKDEQAKSSMYEFFNTQANKYDPHNLLESMITAKEAGIDGPDIQGTRGFTSDKKREAFEAYKKISVNPDINWFEGMWANSKSEEDRKIAMELINDYKVGKISEDEFNMAARDEGFQDWYRKAKLDDQTEGALAGIYDPAYERWSEKFFGREGAPGDAGKNIAERHPVKTGVGATVAIGGTVGTAIGVERRAKRISKATKAYDAALEINKKYSKDPMVKNPKWKSEGKQHGNIKEFIWDKKKGTQAAWTKKGKEASKNLAAAKKAVEDAKKYRIVQGGGKIAKGFKRPLSVGRRVLPGAAGFTAGQKLAERYGGGDVSQVALGLGFGELARRLTKPSNIKRLMPILNRVAKPIATKLGISLAGMAIPEGLSTIAGVGGAAWAAYDIYKIMQASPEIARAIYGALKD